MSYCRWSSDNWKCMLYAYGHVDGGYRIHIAGRKSAGEIPPLADFRTASKEEFSASYDRQNEALEKRELVPIGLPYDGQDFHEPDLEAFLARLLHLREVGYSFPDYVLETVREEIAEEKSPPLAAGGPLIQGEKK